MAHRHSHSRHRQESFGSLVKVLLLSGSFMVVEIVGGLWSGSLALLADSGHMATDTAAVALGLFALWVARKPPTPSRTFGFHRAEILAATANGILLVFVAGWIFYEAWHRFGDPHPISGGWMTAIAVVGLLVNLVALKIVHRHSHSSLNLRAVTLHLIFDALGSAGAITAGILVWGWGLLWADSLVSVIIACLILRGAFKLLVECVDILLESVPAHVDVDALRTDLLAQPGVKAVNDLHVWSIASGVVALSAHVRVSEGADHGALLRCCNQILHERHGIDHSTLQLEPEGYTAEDPHLDCQKPGSSDS